MKVETVIVTMPPGDEPIQINLLDFDADLHRLASQADAARVAEAKASRAANGWRPKYPPQNEAERYAADAEREALRKSTRAAWLKRCGK